MKPRARNWEVTGIDELNANEEKVYRHGNIPFNTYEALHARCLANHEKNGGFALSSSSLL
jgi:hypothetical protein